MVLNSFTEVLIFAFCRTEEQPDGPSVASITRRTVSGQFTYLVKVNESWRDVFHGEPAARIAYVRSFLEHLSFATQGELEELFSTGSHLSAGPIRGKLLRAQSDDL